MTPVGRARTGLRWLASVAFVVAGTLHFARPGWYLPLIPEALGTPAFWNALAGAAEVAGGLGLLVPGLRRPAAAGLAALLLVLLWVHVEMLLEPGRPVFGRVLPAWLLWARLPFQFVLIAWVLFAGGPWRAGGSTRVHAEPMPGA